MSSDRESRTGRSKRPLSPAVAAPCALLAVAAMLGASACDGYLAASGELPRSGTDGSYDSPSTDVSADSKDWSPDAGDSWSSDADSGSNSPTKGCKKKAQKALKSLDKYCSQCHGQGLNKPRGGFGSVTDPAKLKNTGRIVPKKPGQSVVWNRIAKNEMPPPNVNNQPGKKAKRAIKEWISCGAVDPAASRPRVAINDEVTCMQRDLNKITIQAKRERTRYVTLTHLNNSNLTDDELQAEREALSLTLNSLSRERQIEKPAWICKNKTVARIDLEDYGWDAATWRRIVENYPYAVQYDKNSTPKNYSNAASAGTQLRQETRTKIPYVDADWLIEETTKAPLYYEILELPGNLHRLADQLGVDIRKDIRENDVVRAGFSQSGVASENRVIERHDSDNGVFWLSYDFANSKGRRNIFDNPLDFLGDEDANEVIFSLENGLHGYYIANRRGTRIDKAQTDLVTHDQRDDSKVQAGLSCMACHHPKDGIISKKDEIRNHAKNTLFGTATWTKVKKIYPTHSKFEKRQKQDSKRFARAMDKRAGVDSSRNRLIIKSVAAYEEPLTFAEVARTLGVEPKTFRNQITNVPSNLLPAEIQNVATSNGVIPRETFEDLYDVLVCLIDLGQPVEGDGQLRRVGRRCVNVLP